MTLDHKVICENCWYWETITTGREVRGFCKRHAPIVVTSPPDSGSFASLTTTTLWPRTVAEDWCGDFTLKQEMAPNPVPPEEYAGCRSFGVPQCVCGEKPAMIWSEYLGTAQDFAISCSCGRKSQNWGNAYDALLDWNTNVQAK